MSADASDFRIDLMGRLVVDGAVIHPHAPTEPPARERPARCGSKTRPAGCRACGAIFRVAVHTARTPERCPTCRAARKREIDARCARRRRARQREQDQRRSAA